MTSKPLRPTQVPFTRLRTAKRVTLPDPEIKTQNQGRSPRGSEEGSLLERWGKFLQIVSKMSKF